MVLELLLIGTVITIGPLHNTAFILMLSSPRGVRAGLAFILGWLATLVLVIALVLLATGGDPPARDTAPSNAALAVRLVLGVVLVVYGERKRRRGTMPRSTPQWMARLDHVSGWTAAGFGAFLQPWGMVAVGATTVVQAKLTSFASYFALMGYILLATSTILAMELYSTFKPDAARARLTALRAWIEGHQDQTIVSVSLLLGLWLAGNAIYELV